MHRDSKNSEHVIEYKGQFSATHFDEVFQNIINGIIESYYFTKHRNTHVCHKIRKIEEIQSRSIYPPEAPVYKLWISEECPENSILKERYPNYFNNTDMHKEANMKLTSLAKYGFVPQSTKRLSVGILFAYKLL